MPAKLSEAKIINELNSIVAFADELKSKATRLRKSLEGVYHPASLKRVPKISEAEKARIRANRRKTMNKPN